jgi:hypothetical protein
MPKGLPASGRPPGLPDDRCFHLSVDDVFAALFADPRDEGAALSFLASLGADFGAVSDLYLFQEGEAGGARRSLDAVPPENRAYLASQAALRFGPHAFDYETRPYQQSPAAQQRVFGRLLSSIDAFARPSQASLLLRLHYFSECLELAPWFRERGILGLFLTDKPAATYRLDESHRALVRGKGWTEHEGLALLTSHIRFERRLADGASHASVIEEALDAVRRHGFVSLFTHEVDLADPALRAMIRACLGALVAAGVKPALSV